MNEKLRSNDMKQIQLNVGEVIIFHPLLIHRGCAYTQENTRLHLYMDHVDLKRFFYKTTKGKYIFLYL